MHDGRKASGIGVHDDGPGRTGAGRAIRVCLHTRTDGADVIVLADLRATTIGRKHVAHVGLLATEMVREVGHTKHIGVRVLPLVVGEEADTHGRKQGIVGSILHGVLADEPEGMFSVGCPGQGVPGLEPRPHVDLLAIAIEAVRENVSGIAIPHIIDEQRVVACLFGAHACTQVIVGVPETHVIVDIVTVAVTELVECVHERRAVRVATATSHVDALVIEDAVRLRGVRQLSGRWIEVTVSIGLDACQIAWIPVDGGQEVDLEQTAGGEFGFLEAAWHALQASGQGGGAALRVGAPPEVAHRIAPAEIGVVEIDEIAILPDLAAGRSC